MAVVTVKDGKYYKVDYVFQWDIDQELLIYGLSVADPQIHFSNDSMACAIVREPTVDSAGVISVMIPNSLLQKPYPISVYVCGYEGATFKTYAKITIPMKQRPKPGDYTLEVTDKEVYSFNALSKEIADFKKVAGIGSKIPVYNYGYDAENVELIESVNDVYSGEAIALISGSLKAIDSIVETLKSEIRGNDSDIAKLRSDHDTLRSEHDTLAESVNNLIDRIDEMEKDINAELARIEAKITVVSYSDSDPLEVAEGELVAVWEG